MKIDRILGILSVVANTNRITIQDSDLVFSLQDKVKVICPLALKNEIKDII